jgi:hypothetical protein
MHGSPGESLAGALHLEKRLEKQNRKDATWKPAGCMNKKSSIEMICAGADIEALQRTRAKQFPPTVIPQLPSSQLARTP